MDKLQTETAEQALTDALMAVGRQFKQGTHPEVERFYLASSPVAGVITVELDNGVTMKLQATFSGRSYCTGEDSASWDPDED